MELWSLSCRHRRGAGYDLVNVPLVNTQPLIRVTGSVILLSKPYNHNEPLGLEHQQARTSTSSLPSPYGPSSRSASASRGSRQSSRVRPNRAEKKRSKNGQFILDPQPDDSANGTSSSLSCSLSRARVRIRIKPCRATGLHLFHLGMVADDPARPT
jgi:hypothetical protein